MTAKCTDCKRFHEHPGCEKNNEEWGKAKERYPVAKEDANNLQKPQTHNERLRIAYIDSVAAQCQERVPA